MAMRISNIFETSLIKKQNPGAFLRGHFFHSVKMHLYSKMQSDFFNIKTSP